MGKVKSNTHYSSEGVMELIPDSSYSVHRCCNLYTRWQSDITFRQACSYHPLAGTKLYCLV